MERDTWVASAAPPPVEKASARQPDVDMRELLVVLADVLRRAQMYESHHVQREALSTRERMSEILERCRGSSSCPSSPCSTRRGALGVVVTFLAVMELIKESLVEIVQTENFGPIHVKARGE
jgi:segregation and condensation protein A